MSDYIREAIKSVHGAQTAVDVTRAALEGTFGAVEIGQSGEKVVESLRSGRRIAELRGS